MTDAFKGLLAMTAAAAAWGLSGMYYKLLAEVPALEVLSHRILWSAVFFGALILVRGRGAEVIEVLGHRRTLRLLVWAALSIGANWFLFIYSIQGGLALEASLGYYIFPLVAVTLGALTFGERFSRGQAAALALVAAAVLVLTIGLHAPPWIALILAGTFATYGLLKKRTRTGPVISVFAETAVLLPAALVWLAGATFAGWTGPGTAAQAGWFGHDWKVSLLLMGSGVITALPLNLMSYAAQRVKYSTLGLVQYLNPTLQFAVAVAVFGEPFTRWHAIAFPMIWTALLLYAAESLRQERASRRLAISEATLSTGVRNARNSGSAKP
ncbi:MAG: EamA family transporter RarD [Rhodobacteraceae bacterium]|nr:EamA family transporter RarD [Paracoccaceae bacterium]